MSEFTFYEDCKLLNFWKTRELEGIAFHSTAMWCHFFAKTLKEGNYPLSWYCSFYESCKNRKKCEENVLKIRNAKNH